VAAYRSAGRLAAERTGQTPVLQRTVRQADTLLFLSFQGSMGPATVAGMDAGDSATVALAGAQAGSLIWSSGWQAFVGGAIQTKVRVRLTVATERASREAELLWTVTSRLQVRL